MSEYLSHSRMDTYSNCSLQYHFKYNMKLPVISEDVNLNYGKALHKAIELFHLRFKHEGALRDKNYLLDCFIAAWDDSALFGEIPYDRDTYDSHRKMGLNHLNTYYDENISSSWFKYPPIGVELPFEVPIINFETGEVLNEDYNLHGYIDLIIADDEYLHVIDHKTSGKAYSDFKIKNSMQLVIYDYAIKYLQKLGELPNLPIKVWFNVFYKTKKQNVEKYENIIQPIQTKRMLSAANAVIHGIKSETYVPNFGHLWCSYCSFVDACLMWQEVDGKDAWVEEYIKKTDNASNGDRPGD